MQIGRTKLTVEERTRRLRLIRMDSSVIERVLVSQTHCRNCPSCPTITASFSASGALIQQPVLVDSGADANFMDTSIARKLGRGSVPLQN